MNLSQRLSQVGRELPGLLGAGVIALFGQGMRQTMEVAAHHEQFLHWTRCLGIDEDYALETLAVTKTLVAEHNLRTPGYLGPLVPYEMARRELLRELTGGIRDPGRFVCGNDGIRVVQGYDGDWLHARTLKDPPECDSPDPLTDARRS